LSDEFLGDRKKSLEASFFAKQNAALLERMRAQREKQSRGEDLARVSLIRDPEVIDKLVELGLDAASWVALSLVPLVEVAWADGAIERRERDAILAAAVEQGIEPGSPSRSMLESWLCSRPGVLMRPGSPPSSATPSAPRCDVRSSTARARSRSPRAGCSASPASPTRRSA
jgi:hypothetical protein